MGDLGALSDSLVLFSVLTYVVAGVLLGFEFAYRVRWVGRAGVALVVVGLALNLGAAVTRAFAAHRVPWGNMYEFSVMVGILCAAAFLVWVRRRPEVRPLGVFVLLPAVLAMAVAIVALRVPAGPLQPALQSGWIKVHVAAAISGSSLLCVASMFSILYLLKDRTERRAAAGLLPVAGGASTADEAEVDEALAGFREQEAARPSRRRSVWDALPSARTLDELAYRTTAFAFPIWTFAVIAGAIWAQSAWGRYWGWDPKETWSFITWTVYAAYLHGRATAGWRGHRAAWISVLGLAVLIVTFYAVNLWIVGLHSYAGV